MRRKRVVNGVVNALTNAFITRWERVDPQRVYDASAFSFLSFCFHFLFFSFISLVFSLFLLFSLVPTFVFRFFSPRVLNAFTSQFSTRSQRVHFSILNAWALQAPRSRYGSIRCFCLVPRHTSPAVLSLFGAAVTRSQRVPDAFVNAFANALTTRAPTRWQRAYQRVGGRAGVRVDSVCWDGVPEYNTLGKDDCRTASFPKSSGCFSSGPINCKVAMQSYFAN